jgi:hypothetical protein
VTAPDGGVTSYGYVKPPEPKTVYGTGGGGGGGGAVAVVVVVSEPLRRARLHRLDLPAGDDQPLALDYSESFRVLRQHASNWDLRFAYELNGTCAVREPLAMAAAWRQWAK